MSAQRASTAGRKRMQRWGLIAMLLRPSRLSVAMLVVGATISIVTGAAVLSWARHEARHVLNDHFRFAQIAIGQRLRAYTDALDMVGARLAGGELDAASFRHFIGRLRLRRRFRAVRAVLYARRVPGHNGHARLQIAEVTPSVYDGLIGRALSTLRPPLHATRGGARIRLSRLSTARGGSGAPDYALELPIYRDGSTGRALVGAACMLLRMQDLFRLGRLLDPITLEHVRVRVWDVGTAGTGVRRLLFDSDSGTRSRSPSVGSIQSWFGGKPRGETLNFPFGGRVLVLQLTSPQGFARQINAVFPLVVFLGGIVTTLLITAVVGSLAASRRRAEALADGMTARLRESQERLLEAQRIAKLGNWSYDCLERRLEWSEEINRLLGHSPQAPPPSYRTGLHWLHIQDRTRFRGLVRASIRDGRGYEADLRVRHANGHMLWLRLVGLPMITEDARVVLVRGTIMDVTERKRIELRKGVEHTVIRLLAGAAALADVSGRLLEAVCATFGWSSGVYWEWHRESARFVRAGAWGRDESALVELDALLGRGAEHGEPVLLQQAVSAGRAVSTTEQRRSGAGAAFAVPVLAGEQLVGGMEFHCREGCALDEEMISVLHALAAQIGQFCQRQEAEQALRVSEGRLHGIVDSALEAIITVDREHRVVLFNPAAEKLFGYAAVEVLGAPLETFLPPRLREAHATRMRRFETSGDTVRRMGEHIVVSALRRNGEEFPVEASISKITKGGERLYTVILNDITARRRNERQLEFLANYDALTSLPNRSLFGQKLQRALQHAQRLDRRIAVLFIDLDRFKNINDTLGHAAGDDVLQQMAARLVQSLRGSDTVARLGGDEFVVLLEEVTELRDVGLVAHKVLNALAEPLALQGREYHITASIGISAYPLDARDGPTLLKNADIAMYRAKEQGKNNFQFYSARMNVHSVERLTLEANLRRAVERQEFVLHFQPKVALDSGRITSVEALVRWIHPERGMIPPAQFIPIAEETGLIVPIGEWVLKTACAKSRAWSAVGLPPLRVAVNLSARQFTYAELARDVAEVLETSGLDPALLELEITESMVMANPEQSVRTLQQLKAMGIVLAIDDFGTGYSSLAYLKRFPIDLIKVDRSFVQDIPGSADDMAIAKTIIAMARSLRLRVVAEGVETEAQYEFLRDQGCDELQGYYFSKPLTEEAMLALYRAQCETSGIVASIR